MKTPNKILVVDDNSANLTMIHGILSNGAYKVYPVDSGATALRFLERQRPDLMLLDIEMPVMGGYELFSILKADARLEGIPVIFLTAHDAPEQEAEAFRLGAADYIRKPVNDITLLARVRLQLELAALRAEHPGL